MASSLTALLHHFYHSRELRMADQSYFADHRLYRDRCTQDAPWATTVLINDSKVYAHIGQNVYHGNLHSATPDHLPQFGKKVSLGLEPAATRSPGYPWFIAGVPPYRPKTPTIQLDGGATHEGDHSDFDASTCVLVFWIVSMLITRSPFPAFLPAFSRRVRHFNFIRKPFSKRHSLRFSSRCVGLVILAMKRRTLDIGHSPG